MKPERPNPTATTDRPPTVADEDLRLCMALYAQVRTLTRLLHVKRVALEAALVRVGAAPDAGETKRGATC